MHELIVHNFFFFQIVIFDLWSSCMAELKASGDFIVESTIEYLPDRKKTVPVTR